MKSHICGRVARIASLAAALASLGASAAGIDVNPLFPSYGQSIDAQMQGIGAAPFIPATRYRRDGNTFTLEFEHIRGGWFGPRMDMGYVPVSLGELAPGSYAIQARLTDIAQPDEAPWIFTQFVEVAPPDVAGVYTVPRRPNAYENMQVVVRADAPIEPTSLRSSVDAGVVRIDYDYSLDSTRPSFATVKVDGLSPGTWRVEAYGHNAGVGMTALRYSAGVNVDSASTMVEYYNDQLDHYFMTAGPGEIAILDAGQTFKRTGERFKVWLKPTDAPASAVPVCRFYASAANSHYYTAVPAECDYLKAWQQKEMASASAKGQAFGGWTFEGVAFYAIPPQAGTCPFNTRPVSLFYNDRAAQGDPNHRFTVSEPMRLAMKETWKDVGVAFCSPL